MTEVDQWLKARPQSQAVKAREAHAKLMLERYYERTRSKLKKVDLNAVPVNGVPSAQSGETQWK
jgi:hypothetical protein